MSTMAGVEDQDGHALLNVYNTIRAAILDGTLAPASTVSQTALGQIAGASRTPVREAVRILVHEGLVISDENRRVRIRPMTPANLEDLQISRIALESAGIRLTVPRLDPEELAELEGVLAQMAHYHRMEDFDRFEVPHRKFHLMLITGLGQTMTDHVASLYDQVASYRRVYGKPDNFSVRQHEHRELLDFVIAREPDKAATALIDHYLNAVDDVFPGLDPDYSPARLQELAAYLRG